MARMMRKSSHARSTSDVPLLLPSDIRLLLRHGCSGTESPARTTALASGERSAGGVARRTWVPEEQPVGAPWGARSTTKQRPPRARLRASALASGPAPESGDGIGVRFSEGGIESLVRPGGWRRLRRFAGRTGASSVACRGLTPNPTTAIQAVTGSGVDAGQVGGTRSIDKTDILGA